VIQPDICDRKKTMPLSSTLAFLLPVDKVAASRTGNYRASVQAACRAMTCHPQVGILSPVFQALQTHLTRGLLPSSVRHDYHFSEGCYVDNDRFDMLIAPIVRECHWSDFVPVPKHSTDFLKLIRSSPPEENLPSYVTGIVC